MRPRHPALILIALAIAGCDAGLSDPDPTLGPTAELYLRAALDVMETNSVRRYEIDWPSFREIARSAAEAAGAQTPAETYPMISDALERIGDNHSFFVPAGGAPPQLAPSMSVDPANARTRRRAGGRAEVASFEGPAAADASSQLVAPGVGYLDVPAFSGGGSVADSVATRYHALIESVDTLEAVCRWVVDVRGNTGGNMWPMVAGVGPILGEGTVGYFVDPDSLINVWFYQNGQAGFDDVAISGTSTPYTLANAPLVALLTDSLTASAGEAVAVAFRGREGARSFGEATWGVSTANAAFPLNDGSVIFLTITTMAGRDGTVYGRELAPDQVVNGGTRTGDPQTDAVLAAAVDWLNAQTCS